MRNLNEERIEINSEGYCQTYEPGVNEAYAEMDRADMEETEKG
jgi:hypothetical protein